MTTVFVVVGLVFGPYQFLDPVFTTVVQTITTQTATPLSLIGFELSIVVGSSILREVFAETKAIVATLFGVDQPALISFYFAEYILIQALVVAVPIVVYR